MDKYPIYYRESPMLLCISMILITGKDKVDHLNSLSQVLTKLEQVSLRAQESKCKFLTKTVVFLGTVYVLSKESEGASRGTGAQKCV